jgi:hypothetical protein
LLDGTLFTEVTPEPQELFQGNTQGPTIGRSDPIHSATIALSSLQESAFIEALATSMNHPNFEQRLSSVKSTHIAVSKYDFRVLI